MFPKNVLFKKNVMMSVHNTQHKCLDETHSVSSKHLDDSTCGEVAKNPPHGS